MSSVAPSTLPRAWMPSLALALAIIVAVWLAAHWAWVWISARVPTVLEPQATAPVTIDTAAIARAFGDRGEAPAATGSPAPAASNIRLKGVLAATGRRPASAVLNTGGRDVAVLVGGEIEPGVKLARVFPDRVEIDRRGAIESIALDTFARVAPLRPGSAQGPGAVAAGPARRAFPLDVNATGNQFSFSRKRLDDSLKDPATLAATGRIGMAPGGGARVEAAPAGSLAQRLGLQQGDIIRAINGQAIASPGDLARLYQQFPTLNRIEADVQRGAGTVRLTYTVAP